MVADASARKTSSGWSQRLRDDPREGRPMWRMPLGSIAGLMLLMISACSTTRSASLHPLRQQPSKRVTIAVLPFEARGSNQLKPEAAKVRAFQQQYFAT